MSHRADRTSRKASAGDPRLLVVGIALVVASVTMSISEPLRQAWVGAAGDEAECLHGWVGP